MNYQEVEMVNNEALHHFELHVEGHRAFIEYRVKNNKVYLIHTEVPHELQGKGIAALLVEKTFRYLEERGLTVVALCSYVQQFLKRHPEWGRLIA